MIGATELNAGGHCGVIGSARITLIVAIAVGAVLGIVAGTLLAINHCPSLEPLGFDRAGVELTLLLPVNIACA